MTRSDERRSLWRDVANLTDTWLERALDALEGGAQLNPTAVASVFGARVRTESMLLEDDRWAGVLQSMPRPEDTLPGERVPQAEALAAAVESELDTVAGLFEEQIRAFDVALGDVPDAPHEADADAAVRLVDRLDEVSRIAIYIAWLTASSAPATARRSMALLVRIRSLLVRVGRNGECLSLAEHRIRAICASVSEAVLSSHGPTSIRQEQGADRLVPHLRAARESAVCFVTAMARIRSHAIDRREGEVPKSALGMRFQRALLMHSRAMKQGVRETAQAPTPDALAECARWSIEAVRRNTQPEQQAAAVASALLLKPRSLAAADARPHELGLRLRWSAGESRTSEWDRLEVLHDRVRPPSIERTADCHLHEGMANAAITFYRGAELDPEVNGLAVTWLGMTSTASESRAIFDLDALRKDVSPSTLLTRLARHMTNLWVGNSPWTCAQIGQASSR